LCRRQYAAEFEETKLKLPALSYSRLSLEAEDAVSLVWSRHIRRHLKQVVSPIGKLEVSNEAALLTFLILRASSVKQKLQVISLLRFVLPLYFIRLKLICVPLDVPFVADADSMPRRSYKWGVYPYCSLRRAA
jgi:hypothetical protein